MNIINLLTEKQKESLTIKKYSKDQIIYHESSLCNEVCIVLKGSIKIASYSYEGKEIIYSIIKENEMFGNNLLFSSIPKYKGNVICLSSVELVSIKKQQVLQLFEENEKFLEYYLKYDADIFKNLNDKLKILSFDNAKDRLIYYLLINNKKIEIDSISYLASTLFLSRECLSRLIHKLQKDGIIEFKSNTILLKLFGKAEKSY